MRSFYMQYRRNQIFDGQPPREKDSDEDDSSDSDNDKAATDANAAGGAADKTPSPDKKESQ